MLFTTTDFVQVNAAPLSIQLTHQFFKRMMGFFFPDKAVTSAVEDYSSFAGTLDRKDSRGTTLLGLPSNSGGLDHRASIRSLPVRPPPPSPSSFSASSNLRRNKLVCEVLFLDVNKFTIIRS